ncbi:MAG: N-acetyltransferase [Clostridiales bacterium]|nr:N-acetyltransferase [Clostridiales bacterium]
MELKTERLTLKPLSDSDRDAMKELMTNETIKKTFMIPDACSDEALEKMFAALKRQSNSDDHYFRGIYLDNALIGFINDVEIKDKSIEIGWAVHPKHHNRGYATEAAKRVIEDLFSLGYTKVVAGAFIENPASFKVMEKLGMKPNGFSENIDYHGSLHRCDYYEITN